MRNLKIGILGANGAVGREMLRLIEEYKLPVSELRLLTGPHSVGHRVLFRGEEQRLLPTEAGSFAALDYVLGAADAAVSRRCADAIRSSGAVYIDNSSLFRLDPEVPLIVPEINGGDAFRHKGIIANPNCCTILTLMAVAGIHLLSPIRSMTVSTYQSVSGAGLAGLRELEAQLRATIEGEELTAEVFPAPIAGNVIPCIGAITANGYTEEEMKMQWEGRRILHQPDLCVTCTCVRVPVLRSHSIAVTVRTEDLVSPADAEKAIRAFQGCRVSDGERPYPTPLDVEDQDLVWVGRIRRDLCDPRALALWCCGDQLRKGAAANALQILCLLERSR
ncbi:MAG: aspartate-semialdehyde dehydrogenase [Oscillospiraceae bacterium]|nr:aspartate-semialdehyde dehydrogenase [Oscillospiraceae bacterium]